MTTATSSPKKKSTLKPKYVSEHIRRQFIDANMTPFIYMVNLFRPAKAQIFSDYYSEEKLQPSNRKGNELAYDVASFCKDHFPDYVRKTKDMDIPYIEFWLEMHARGFRSHPDHVAEYKRRFNHSHGRLQHLRYYSAFPNFDIEMHLSYFILLLAEQGYDFSTFLEEVKELDIRHRSTPIRFRELNTYSSEKTNVQYLNLVGIDICSKTVRPVVEFKFFSSYEEKFMMSAQNIFFTLGETRPNLVSIDRDALIHLFDESETDVVKPLAQDACLFFNISIFMDDNGQPTRGNVETWFRLGEHGLEYDFMLRTYNDLIISPETTYYYHTRTGILKDSPNHRKYSPKHEYSNIHQHSNNQDVMHANARGSTSFVEVITPDFIEHPSFKYSGIDTLLLNRPEEFDPSKLMPMSDKDEDIQQMLDGIYQFFLDNPYPLYLSNEVYYCNGKTLALVNSSLYHLLGEETPNNPLNRNFNNSPNVGYRKFFEYYVNNPAIEQVLKDSFLHQYGISLITNSVNLVNPNARNSLDAVGINRNIVNTIRHLHRLRNEKLPVIRDRYEETYRQNPNFYQNQRARARHNNGYNYSVSNAIEESFSTTVFMSKLLNYFNTCEGPGEAFVQSYEEYLDYIIEVLPNNLPSLSSILSACSMNFLIENESHAINIAFSQYLNYMRHAVQYQALDFQDFHVQFKDYLSMKVQVHKHTDFEYYPRPSIRLAHDLALRDFNLIKREHDRKSFDAQVSRYAQLYTYEPNTGDYVVIAPKTPEDVIEEGRNLRHCVGSYVSRIIDGRSYVMFLRKKEDPDKSFVTIDINEHNRIVQVQGSSGGMRSRFGEDVESFLNQYRAHLSTLTTNPSRIIHT